MPLQLRGGYLGIVPQTVDNARHTAGKRCAVIRYAKAHGVAGTNFDGDAAFLAESHQFLSKGHYKAVEVRTGDVLKVAAGADALIQRFLDDAEVLVHRLAAGQVHLMENVIIAAGNKDARFLHTGLFHQLKILLIGANPCGDFGKLQAKILAAAKRFLVLIGIKEKLALPNKPFGAAKAAHQLEQVHNLCRGEGAY